MALPDTFHQTRRSDTPTTVLSTQLNSLANNAGAITTTAISNDATTEEDLYGIFQLAVTFGTAPTDRSPIDLYLIQSVDGANYEDGASGASPVTPRRAPDYVFGVRNVTTAQRQISPQLALPARDFHALLVNRAGQAFPASGSTLTAIFVRGAVRE